MLNKKRYAMNLYNPQLKFDKTQLPTLTNWQHFGPEEYVTDLKPAANWFIAQKQARENGEIIFLQPNEARRDEVGMRVFWVWKIKIQKY